VKAGWKIKPLGELCDILDSKRKPVTKSDRVPGPYPYYGATGIQDFVADFIFDEPFVCKCFYRFVFVNALGIHPNHYTTWKRNTQV
jgi:hypothetical protein